MSLSSEKSPSPAPSAPSATPTATPQAATPAPSLTVVEQREELLNPPPASSFKELDEREKRLKNELAALALEENASNASLALQTALDAEIDLLNAERSRLLALKLLAEKTRTPFDCVYRKTYEEAFSLYEKSLEYLDAGIIKMEFVYATFPVEYSNLGLASKQQSIESKRAGTASGLLEVEKKLGEC